MRAWLNPKSFCGVIKKLILNRWGCSKPHAVLGLLCLSVWGSWWCQRGVGCSSSPSLLCTLVLCLLTPELSPVLS